MFDSMFLLFGVAVFVAVVLAVEGAYVWWNSTRGPETKRMERRLTAMSAGGHGGEQLSLMKQRVLSNSPGMARLLLSIPRIGVLDRLLVQSGLSMTVGDLVQIVVIFFLAGIFGSVTLGKGWILGLVLGLGLACLPVAYVLRARRKRLSQLETQLPDAIDLMGRALRAGHAFPTALQMVGEEMVDPVGGEFRILFDETNYGVAMQDALLNLVARVPSTDLKYFVVAVLIQRETGGNLTELLDSISSMVRSRLKLMGEVRTLSAEGKLSAWILALTPFATGFLINVMNPKFMAVLWDDPSGIKFVYGALGLMAFGIFWMTRIIDIRV